MSYEPLHHKYRPQIFAELVGQEAIATTLTNALRQNRIAPAYLFTGPRGTGKTSSARILAKSLNCLASNGPTEKPCGKCDVCKSIINGSSIDIIEIDAASNTGVDHIRELIERVQFVPAQCRYKVYIIDEVHMLSVAAFNALLKTLEEPPSRVVFVLATTDAQRVLPTIISRCQRYDFRRIPLEAMVRHLKAIANTENINIADDAVTLVGQIAQGGLRDAESLLDQLSLCEGEVTVEQIWDLVGAVPETDLMQLVEAIASDIPSNVLTLARQIMDRGREPLILLQNLASFYRDLLIAKTAPTRSDLVAITPPTWKNLCEFAQTRDISPILAAQKHLRDSEVQIKNTTQPRLWLEVTVLGLLPSAINAQVSTVSHQPMSQPTGTPKTSPQNSPTASIAQPTSPTNPESKIPKSPNPVSSTPPKTEETPVASDRQEASPQPKPELTGSDGDLERIWQNVLAHIEPFSARSLLSQHCQLLSFKDSVARLGISSNPLYKLAQGKMRQVEEAFLKAFNQTVKVLLEVAGTQASNGSLTEEKPEFLPQSSAASSDRAISESRSPASPAPSQTNNDVKSANNSSVNQSSVAPPSAPLNSQTVNGARANVPTGQEDEEEELDLAAQQVIEYFNGSEIALTSELSAIATPTSKQRDSTPELPPTSSPTHDNNKEDEDDGDIPF